MQLLGAGYPAGGMHSSFSAAGATTRVSLWVVPWLVLVFGLLLVKLFGKFVAPEARVGGWLPRLAIAAVSGLVFAGIFILLVATAPFRMSGEGGGGVFTVTTGSFWRAAVAFAIATAAVFLMLLPRERGRVRAALRSATSTVTEHVGSMAVIGAFVMLWFGLQRLGEATIVRPLVPDDESVLQGLRLGANDLMGGGDTDVFTAIAKSIPLVFVFALPWLGPDFGLNGVSLTHLIPSGFHGSLTTRSLTDGDSDRLAFGRDGLTDSVSLVGHGVSWWVWVVAAVVVLLWILLASLRWRIRRGAPGPMLDAVWLPLVYAVAGVVVTFAGRMAFHAEADAGGAVPLWGSGYIGPEWWGIFVFMGVGVLVEGASRLIAVPALKAAPRWIIGLVSIGLGRKQPIVPAGRPVGELRPSASKGAKLGWGLASSVVVAALVLGVGTMGVGAALPRVVTTPGKEVASFLDDVIDGKAIAAMNHYESGRLQSTYGWKSTKKLWTDKVYSKVKNRPDGYKVLESHIVGGVAVVRTRVHQNGKNYEVTFTVQRSGSVVPRWKMRASFAKDQGVSMPVGGLTVSASANDHVSAGDVELEKIADSTFGGAVLPGTYSIGTADSSPQDVDVRLGHFSGVSIAGHEDNGDSSSGEDEDQDPDDSSSDDSGSTGEDSNNDADDDSDRDQAEDPEQVKRQALARAKANGAWHEAGSSNPSGVKDASTWSENGPKPGSNYMFLRSPTGNITCRIARSGNADCDNYNWSSQAAGSRTQWVFSFDTTQAAQEYDGSDAYTITSHDSSVKHDMANGETVGWGNFVCHADTTALTCWNTETGHGAFMRQQSDRSAW
jgi:hypothetical protein